MRNIARPCDVYLFHDDIDKYIEQSTAQTIAVYINSHRRAIVNSVKKHSDNSITGSTTIIKWVRGTTNDNDEAIAKIHALQRTRLLNTNKEKERPVRQPRNSRNLKSEIKSRKNLKFYTVRHSTV
jgi:hypothetical protein